jgi:hypothetical protein
VTRATHAAAMALGFFGGMLLAALVLADEVTTLQRGRDLAESRLWACERVVGTDYTSAQDRAAERCELAAGACAQVATSVVALEQRQRSFLQLGPGPRVRR